MAKTSVMIDCENPHLRYLLFDEVAKALESRKLRFITVWGCDERTAYSVNDGDDDFIVIAIKQSEMSGPVDEAKLEAFRKKRA
jgi:hypothetical protein